MSDTSDPLEILNAIDRERGESFIGMIQANQVQRLRTEIVALRETLERHDRLVIKAVAVATPSIRNEALEVAARLCECGYTTGSTASTLKAIAVAIRALKEGAR